MYLRMNMGVSVYHCILEKDSDKFKTLEDKQTLGLLPGDHTPLCSLHGN